MKRFTDEAEILALIDKYTEEARALSNSADNLDAQADSYRGTENAFQIGGLRDVADKARERVVWRHRRISHLKDKLAEFRTQPLVGVLDDGSVEGI